MTACAYDGDVYVGMMIIEDGLEDPNQRHICKLLCVKIGRRCYFFGMDGVPTMDDGVGFHLWQR